MRYVVLRGIESVVSDETFFKSLTDGMNIAIYLMFAISSVTIIFLEWNDIKNKEKSLAGELALTESEIIQENMEKDFFTNLVKINFKYIDTYYHQTQVQANNSFNVSMFSAVSAFLIIILGIVLMCFNKVQSAYVSVAAGMLSELTETDETQLPLLLSRADEIKHGTIGQVRENYFLPSSRDFK